MSELANWWFGIGVVATGVVWLAVRQRRNYVRQQNVDGEMRKERLRNL